MKPDEFLAKLRSLRWGLVFSVALSWFSFSIVHYISFMTWFAGPMLMVYASSFYFDFLFVMLFHLATGYFFGKLFLAAGFGVIPSIIDSSLKIRRWKSGRALILFCLKSQRNVVRGHALAFLLGVGGALFVYLGPLRFFLFLVSFLVFLNAIFFFQDQRSDVKSSLVKIRRTHSKPLNHFGSSQFWSLGGHGSIAHMLSDFFSLKFIKPKNLNGTTAGVALLSVAVLAGILRADKVMQSDFQLSLHTDNGSMSGSVYGSSTYGILFWRSEDSHVFFVPIGSFRIEGIPP